ncbi:MAG: C39 family peptidase [Pseudomonadota bacterium]|nr:C39 family peptidase [Pseudomonadota bacterium]
MLKRTTQSKGQHRGIKQISVYRGPLPTRFKSFFYLLSLAAVIATIYGTASLAAERQTVKSLLEIRQDKVIVQEWDLSCGAAALATLLNYQHNDPVAEREVATGLIQRKEYIETPELVKIRQGFSLLDLKRYADKRGYEGVGFGRLTIDDLIEHAPLIVPISQHGYNHFVIFRGKKGNRVLLADPAWGNRTMLVEHFERAWIDFPEIGRVGFEVARRDETKPPNQLAPLPDDFVMLR